MNKIFFLLLLSNFSLHLSAQIGEETAIKTLLEKESATWRIGDIKGHAACWKIQPYSKILISTGDGTVLDVPPELMINPTKGMTGNGGTSTNSNYNMNIQENYA